MPEARVALMPPMEASAPGSIGKEESGVLDVRVERLARHAGLHHGVEVFRMHLEHAVHARHVQRHAAVMARM